MNRNRLAWALIVCTLAAATGCDLGTPATPTPLANPTPVPTQGTDATPTSAIEDFRIVFDTSGTIAGIHRVMEIAAGGDITLTVDRGATVTGQIAEPDARRLADMFETANFFNLDDRYDQGNVSDDTYYTITFDRGGETRTVVVAEVGGQDITPQPLLDIIAELKEIEADVLSKATPGSTVTP